MKHHHFSEAAASPVEEGATGVTIRWLIDEDMGARKFVMRQFEIAPGGSTPLHKHDWEHEVYILTGNGTVFGNGRHNPLKPGDVVFMPGGEEHQFRNTSKRPLTFLCLIPARK